VEADSWKVSATIAKAAVRNSADPRASKIRTAKEKPINKSTSFIWSRTLNMNKERKEFVFFLSRE